MNGTIKNEIFVSEKIESTKAMVTLVNQLYHRLV